MFHNNETNYCFILIFLGGDFIFNTSYNMMFNFFAPVYNSVFIFLTDLGEIIPWPNYISIGYFISENLMKNENF